jgi:hypothetical protein
MHHPLPAKVLVMSRMAERNFIMGEVSLECIRQDTKWGEQPPESFRDMLNNCIDIELYDEAVREDAIEIAALAIQMIAAIDRRKAK